MIRLRRAAFGDAKAIAHVHVETWRSAYAGLLPNEALIGMTTARKSRIWRHVLGGQGGGEAVLVADHPTDGVIGFGSCGAARHRVSGCAGEVYTLYVLPDHHGKQIGRGLLVSLLDELVGDGLGSAMVWVLAGNPSKFFYEALGGQVAGNRRERLWGAELDEACYVWPDLRAALGPAGPLRASGQGRRAIPRQRKML